MAKARKSKSKADDPGAGQAEKRPELALNLIAQRTLVSLLREDDNYKGRIDGLVGELRESIGNAADKKHLDKKAYALLKKFHRMKSTEELARVWHTLLAYMDMAGVMKRIDSVSELDLAGDGESAEEEEAEEGEAEEEEEESGGEVSRPRFGGRPGALQ